MNLKQKAKLILFSLSIGCCSIQNALATFGDRNFELAAIGYCTFRQAAGRQSSMPAEFRDMVTGVRSFSCASRSDWLAGLSTETQGLLRTTLSRQATPDFGQLSTHETRGDRPWSLNPHLNLLREASWSHLSRCRDVWSRPAASRGSCPGDRDHSANSMTIEGTTRRLCEFYHYEGPLCAQYGTPTSRFNDYGFIRECYLHRHVGNIVIELPRDVRPDGSPDGDLTMTFQCPSAVTLSRFGSAEGYRDACRRVYKRYRRDRSAPGNSSLPLYRNCPRDLLREDSESTEALCDLFENEGIFCRALSNDLTIREIDERDRVTESPAPGTRTPQ